MRFDFFSFGGLDVLETRRAVEGLVTFVRTPRRSGPAAASDHDLRRIARVMSEGRSPSPVVCFVPDERVEPGADDDAALATNLETVRRMMDVDAPVLRLAELRSDGCAATALALCHHVVFAAREATFDMTSFSHPALAELRRRRGGRWPVGTATATDLHDRGVVDVLYDGDVEAAMEDYARRNDRRRVGETGVHEAIRRALAEATPPTSDVVRTWREARRPS